MKRLWIATALLLVLLAGSLLDAWYAKQLTDSLSQRLEQAQTLTEEGQWEQAEKLTQQVCQDWEKHHFYLHTVLRHSDTDQIFRSFQAVLQYLSLQEMDQYAAANADLIAQLHLLAEMEQASLVNVL
jgi:thioredoxin-like negative regulator of GroEL